MAWRVKVEGAVRIVSVTMSGSNRTRSTARPDVGAGALQEIAGTLVEEVHPDLGQDPEGRDVDRFELVG